MREAQSSAWYRILRHLYELFPKMLLGKKSNLLSGISIDSLELKPAE